MNNKTRHRPSKKSRGGNVDYSATRKSRKSSIKYNIDNSKYYQERGFERESQFKKRILDDSKSKYNSVENPFNSRKSIHDYNITNSQNQRLMDYYKSLENSNNNRNNIENNDRNSKKSFFSDLYSFFRIKQS